MGDWKKVYSAPRLTAYGHVTTLTQAGTVNAAEGQGQSMMDINLML